LIFTGIFFNNEFNEYMHQSNIYFLF
jgi:hypothetical protein